MTTLEDIETGETEDATTVFVPPSQSPGEYSEAANIKTKVKSRRLWEKLSTESSSKFDKVIGGRKSLNVAKQKKTSYENSANSDKPLVKISDFFTNDSTEGESKVLLKDNEETIKEQELTSEDNELEDSGTASIDSILPRKIEILMYTIAKYLPFHERLAHALSYLFFPDVKDSSLRQKLKERKTRNLEDEGLYLGEKPYMSKSSLKIVQNRLMKQEKKFWFDDTGDIIRGDKPFTEPMALRFDEEAKTKPIYAFVPSLTMDEFNKSGQARLVAGEKKGILIIKLGEMRFTSHPLFSTEQRYAALLKEEVKTYRDRRIQRVSAIAIEKLKVLRHSLNKLEQISPPFRGSAAVRIELDSARRLALYRSEIKECRQIAREEGETDRKLTSSILQLWSLMKEARKSSGFQSTDLNLVIHKIAGKSKKNEVKKYKDAQTIEVEEIYSELLAERKNEMIEYHAQMKKWKADHNLRVIFNLSGRDFGRGLLIGKEALKRQNRIAGMDAEDLREDEILQMAKDQITLATPEQLKPTHPEEIQKEEVRKEVEEWFKKSFRPPGEPELDFELQNSSSITPTQSCLTSERQRRNVASKTKLWLKILINNKALTQTSVTKLKAEFRLCIETSILASVLSWPHEIRLEVYEGFGLRQKLISKIQLPLPLNHDVESNEVIYDQISFGKIQSMAELINQTLQKKVPHTGCLQYKVTWKKNEEGIALLPSGRPPPSKDAHSKFPTPAVFSLDPNDPRNAQSLSYDLRSRSSNEPEGFDLHGEEDMFCSEEELATSVRLRVLRLRNQGVPEFKNLRFVPPNENEVLKKSLENYDHQSDQLVRNEDQSDHSEYGENERKSRALAIIQSVIRRLEVHSSQLDTEPALEDIVVEEQIPNIGSIGEVLTFLKPRRPLKPNRKKRGPVKGLAPSDQNVDLLIYIARGFHIPMRQESSKATNESSSSTTSEDFRSDSDNDVVHPFVEVSFQRSTERTYTSRGSNPTWNQQLILPFKAPNDDYNASSLQTVEDNVFFHLYDEVVHDLLEDERLRETVVHQHIEKRWLGSLKIPLSTIYLKNKIEGTFRLDSPYVLLEYSMSDVNSVDSKLKLNESSNHNIGLESTHLSLYITLEPTLVQSEPLQETFDSLEPDEIIEEGNTYTASLMDKFPQRHFRTHVLDYFGKSVCISRYLRPLGPPEEVLGDRSKEIERVAWYVSLLPSYAFVKKTPDMPLVWANSEQFVNFGTGNVDEQAILLTNYFLFLGYTAYLLIGSGIPEGVSSYVLANIESVWKVFCPSSAVCYDVFQAHSPLKAVYMLIDQDNIYANIQRYEDPPRINFNTKSQSDWKPFFHSSFKDPGLPSVQPQLLSYKEVDENKWKDLKEKLQIILRDAIMKWRPLERTPWNRYANATLKRLLKSYESIARERKNVTLDTTELSTIMRTYKVCGVCIHQEYTTIAAIVEAVHSAGIHKVQMPRSEFALAVEVVPYPGEAASIWVYIASLFRKDRR